MSASDTLDLPYLSELNEAQRAAVVYNDGPALVIAGAGSGKTRVLVYKLLYLLDSGYHPAGLMALTFTNKAAREMQARISQHVGSVARQIHMGTFHSIFGKILRQHAQLLGYTSDFSIYNTNDSRSRIKAIIKQLGLDDKTYKPNVVHNRISSAKNRLITANAYAAYSDFIKYDAKSGLPKLYEVYLHYESELKRANAMDFDDLLLQINILFRQHPDVLKLWQERIDYLLIDEYQDTNFAQYMIARQLMQDKGAIFVVGDDAQSIYSFRGANLDNILSFEKTFPTARTFKLERNYRSTQTIVKAAGQIIANNEYQIPKEVFSEESVGDPITVHEALTGDLEALWVADEVQRLHRNGDNYSSVAVLYRTNAQSRTLEQVFRRVGLPFRIYGGRSFFDHKEIMDVIAYFRVLVNELDEEALLRIINYPKRSIGDTTIQRVRQAASQQGLPMMHILRDPLGYGVEVNKPTAARLQAFAALLDDLRTYNQQEGDLYAIAERVINETGILTDLKSDTTSEGKARVENIQELLGGIDEYIHAALEVGQAPTLGVYLSEIALMTDQDKEGEEGDSITLMTVHSAKGLEFPHVFIVGMEEDLFPSMMSNIGKELEEERRLFYVALTRAEKTCHIGYARERFRNGRTEFSRPSRFVRELPKELVTFDSGLSSHASPWDRPKAVRPTGGNLPTDFSDRPVFHATPSAPSTPSRRVFIERREAGDAPEEKHTHIGALAVGGRVLHKRFGAGVINELEGRGDNAKATVTFDTGETKKLLLRFAQLEVL
jgi:ATP-dependent DNA helicase uvrD/pcrA/rep family